MSIQSASANSDSALTLKKMIIECKKLLELYSDVGKKIKKDKDSFWKGDAFGLSSVQLRPEIKDSFVLGGQKKGWCWHATGIRYNKDMIGTKLEGIDTFISKIKRVNDELTKLIKYSDNLNNLADEIEKYQKQINKALSNDKIKSAAVSSMVAKFASNKYDAKNGDYIPKEKVSTASDSWEGDLKFVRQDNGTYLVIKVGKDGSEVPMGYTTREGKNKYYEEAKKNVLNDLKNKTKSSKEKTNSDSNSKSDSTSDNYVSSTDISKTIYQNSRSKWFGAGALSDEEKILVSKQMASDMKDERHTAADLKDYVYDYRTELEDGNKVVYVEAAKIEQNGPYALKVSDRKFTAKYDLNTLKNRS